MTCVACLSQPQGASAAACPLQGRQTSIWESLPWCDLRLRATQAWKSAADLCLAKSRALRVAAQGTSLQCRLDVLGSAVRTAACRTHRHALTRSKGASLLLQVLGCFGGGRAQLHKALHPVHLLVHVAEGRPVDLPTQEGGAHAEALHEAATQLHSRRWSQLLEATAERVGKYRHCDKGTSMWLSIKGLPLLQRSTRRAHTTRHKARSHDALTVCGSARESCWTG